MEYIFIGGHRKCGTTMLLNLLDGHAELLVYPIDMTIFYAYYPFYNNQNHTLKEKKERLNEIIFKNFHNKLKKHDNVIFDLEKMKNHFFDYLEDSQIDDILHVTDAMLKSYCFAKGIHLEDFSRVVFKETSIEIYAKLLFDNFENVKIIELIRDPRDNFAALKAGVEKYYSKNGEDKNALLMSMIHRLQVSKKIGLLNYAKYQNTNYITIKFEDLTQSTINTMIKLSAFLGIKYSNKMSSPTFMGEETGGNNWDGLKFSNVTNQNVNNWQNRISFEEAKIIEFHLSDIMTLENYPLFFKKDQMLDSIVDFYKWANYRYYFKDSFKKAMQND